MITAYGGGFHWAGTVSLGEPAAVTLSASVPLSAPSTCLLSPPLYLLLPMTLLVTTYTLGTLLLATAGH